MARGCGYDLRIRVIKSVDAGQSITAISKLYQVGRATVYRWINQRNREGDIHPKTHWQKGYGHKIPDLKAFKKFGLFNSLRCWVPKRGYSGIKIITK